MLRMALSFICAFASACIGFSQQLPQTKPSGYSSVRIVSSDEKIYTVEFELKRVPNPHSGQIASFPRVERDGQGDWYICRELNRNVEVMGASEFARFYSEPLLVMCGPGAGRPCPAPNPANYQVNYGFESWDDPVFGVPTTIKVNMEIMMVKDPAKAKCPVFEQEFRKEYVFGASKFWYRADGHMSVDGYKYDWEGPDTLWIPSHNQMPQSYCTNKLVIKEREGDTSFRVGNWGDTGPVVSYIAVGRGLAVVQTLVSVCMFGSLLPTMTKFLRQR